MKKSTIIVIIVLALYFLFPFLSIYLEYSEINLNPFDYARITDVDYKAIVWDKPDNGGKILVTERITFDVHAASEDNPFWELWRDLPEDYVDGLKVDYNVISVKQILPNGSSIVYEESPKLYWDDYDYVSSNKLYGPGKWYHSKGPYDEFSRDYECVFFYVDGLYREEVVFEIQYEMNNAALRYNDCSELYLCLYSEDTIKHLESFKAQILFPNEDMPSKGNYTAYTYGTNSHEFPFTESETMYPGYHTFSFELDESDLKFKPYNEYIEFSLVSYNDDAHIFTEYAPSNKYSSDDVLSELKYEQIEYRSLPTIFTAAKIVIFLLCITFTFLIIRYNLKIDKKMKKKHIFYTPSAQFDYYRDIPSDLDPTFAAALVFCKDEKPKENEDGYAAIMLSLVRKGYIELERIRFDGDWNFNNVKIVIKYQPSPISSMPFSYTPNPIEFPTIESLMQSNIESDEPELEPLTLSEEYYFNLIKKYSYDNQLTMSSFQSNIYRDYENTDSFVRNMKHSIVRTGVSKGYFQKLDYEQPKQQIKKFASKLKIIGFLLVILLNVLCYSTRLDFAFGSFFILGITCVIASNKLKKVSNKYVLLTQFGEDEYVKWRGLYNYLNSPNFMTESTVTDLSKWEHYLVYATAFGISEKVINVLNIRCPEYNAASKPILRNRYYRSRSFYSTHRSFRRTTHTVSHSYRSGGYSSGGSWRIRRWWPRRRWRRWRSLIITTFIHFFVKY